MSKNEKQVCLGKITSAHGIKGAVKIHTFTEYPEDLVSYGDLYDSKGKFYKIKILSVTGEKGVIAKIDGIDDRNTSELLRNTELFVNRSAIPESGKGEYYYTDLIGLEAKTSDGKVLGKVVNVNDFGAGTMLEVELVNPEREKDRFQTFSFIDETVPEVNIKKGYVVINVPEYV